MNIASPKNVPAEITAATAAAAKRIARMKTPFDAKRLAANAFLEAHPEIGNYDFYRAINAEIEKLPWGYGL